MNHPSQAPKSYSEPKLVIFKYAKEIAQSKNATTKSKVLGLESERERSDMLCSYYVLSDIDRFNKTTITNITEPN